MRRTENSGKKQQLPAEHICTVHANEKTGLSAEYADYDGKPHTGHRKYLEDMTGITVMHTARSPI